MPRELDPKRACTHPAGRTAPPPAAVFLPTLSHPHKGWFPTISRVHVSPETLRETPPPCPNRSPSPPGARPLTRLYLHAALARLCLTLHQCQTPLLRAATRKAEARHAACCPASFLDAPVRSLALPPVPLQPRDPLTLGLRKHPRLNLH